MNIILAKHKLKLNLGLSFGKFYLAKRIIFLLPSSAKTMLQTNVLWSKFWGHSIIFFLFFLLLKHNLNIYGFNVIIWLVALYFHLWWQSDNNFWTVCPILEVQNYKLVKI